MLPHGELDVVSQRRKPSVLWIVVRAKEPSSEWTKTRSHMRDLTAYHTGLGAQHRTRPDRGRRRQPTRFTEKLIVAREITSCDCSVMKSVRPRERRGLSISCESKSSLTSKLIDLGK